MKLEIINPRLILRAVNRSRWALLTIAFTHLISIIVGILMVNTGNQFALSYRDDLVTRAQISDPAAIALQKGEKLQAALIDFSRNLLLGAIPNTIGGLSVVIPYPLASYRGWVGGIVSVDGAHVSRLANSSRATYYILTVVLQLIPFSLAGGVGVNMGLAYLRPPEYYMGRRWLGIPKEAVLDTMRIYLLIIPLFLVASLWEFLAA